MTLPNKLNIKCKQKPAIIPSIKKLKAVVNITATYHLKKLKPCEIKQPAIMPTPKINT